MAVLVAVLDAPIIILHGCLELRGVVLQVNTRQGCQQGGEGFFLFEQGLF